jgi:hypothetical protein
MEKNMTKETNRATSSPLSSVRIIGEGFDEWKNRYLKLKVNNSTELPPYSMRSISKDPETLYADLCNAGANVLTAKTKGRLLLMLEEQAPEPATFMVATYPGWHGSTLVFPDKSFGESKLPTETSFVDLDVQMIAKYRTRGPLQDWQDRIWALCQGNSRLIFALSLAAAPLILPLVKGPRSGGFQLVGLPETGKTCAAMVAGSFWGCHRAEGRREKGFAESWNTTEGKIEVTALAHNHSLLILDETKRAGKNDSDRGKNVLNMTVGLAEHTERERLTNSGSARSCCCYFFSTSNYSLDELAEKAQIEVDDAERGRLVDIVLPSGGYGLYENLHGFDTGASLTDELKVRSGQFYGTPRHEFAKQLGTDRKEDKQHLKSWLHGRRRQYLKELKREVDKLLRQTPGAKPPLQRASGKFATVFAAGALAIKYGVFLCSRQELLAAILSCQLDGPRSSVSISRPRVLRFKDKLIDYLREGVPNFMDLDAHRPNVEEHQFGSVPGYTATYKGEKWLYLKADQLDAVIGTGAAASAIKKELADTGFMARTKDRFVVQRPIFSGLKKNKGFRSVHAFKASILDDVSG